MLRHDLSYPEKVRIHCADCNFDLEHFTTGHTWLEEGGVRMSALTVVCRLCENEVEIPLEFVASKCGVLNRLIVRR